MMRGHILPHLVCLISLATSAEPHEEEKNA